MFTFLDFFAIIFNIIPYVTILQDVVIVFVPIVVVDII